MGFYKFFYILFIAITLSACGSGGGGNSEVSNIQSSSNVPVSTGLNGQKVDLALSPDGPGSSYRGKSDRTILTESNANNIVDAVFSLYDFIATDETISLSAEGGRVSTQNRHETVDGLVSGYYELSGDSNQNGTYHITTSWKDYNNGDGTTINGESKFELIGHYVGGDFEYFIETDKIATFKELKITDHEEYIVLDGTIRSRVDPINYEETTIYDLDIFHSSTNTWLSLDDLKYDNNSDITGRIYLSEYGFVDIDTKSTLKPCSYPYVCPDENYFFSEGALQIIGQNSQLDVKAIIYGARVILNSSPSTAHYYPWANLSGSPLPNKEPVFNHIFAQTDFYSDTRIVLQYSVDDPEGESLDVDIKWFINDQQLAGVSGNILSEQYISPGDTISVHILASDGITSSESSQSIEIKQDRIFSDTSEIISNLGTKALEQLDVIDLDQDNLQDIVYIDRDPRNNDKLTLGIMKQELLGVFSEPSIFEITNINESRNEAKLIIKDINNDQLQDIIIHTDAVFGGEGLEIFKQNQEGSFVQTDTLLIPYDSSLFRRSIEIVDIYKDDSSLLEFVVISSLANSGISGNNGPVHSFEIIPLSADLTFDLAQRSIQDIEMTSSSNHNDITIMDRNGDGHLDILFSSFDFSSGETIFETVLQDSSNHSFQVRSSNTEYVITRGKILLVADLNNDLLIDLVLNSTDGFKVFHQNELGNFIYSGTELAYNSTSTASSDTIELKLKIAPSHHEIVVLDNSWADISIYSNIDGTFKLTNEDTLYSRVSNWDLADINNDGSYDAIDLSRDRDEGGYQLSIIYGL